MVLNRLHCNKSSFLQHCFYDLRTGRHGPKRKFIRTGFSCGTIENSITLSGIPPLAGFCSKFYLFFAALGCGAYFLASVGVVTSVIGCWAAGRLPRVSQFGRPKAVLRAPDT
ncbi:hypothetical protein Leryth_025488 [Lithospermum erythrorhizon]|nr:hypothetical protein Leryth_025488 [Lithospermum erythrorhizon]